MGKLLDQDAWAKIVPPFSYVKRTDADFSANEIKASIIWLSTVAGGWFYFESERILVFEQDQDMVAFKLWAASGIGETADDA